jgi:hypothetical protein
LLVAAMSAGCADDVSPAARVGDDEITTDELLAEVAEWAGNANTPRAEQLAATAAPSGYAISPVIAILQERILLEMLAPAFDDLGLELTPDLRDQALQLLGVDPSQADALFADFSEDYINSFLDGYAKGIAVQTELGEEGFLELLRESAKDVEVNPRYGTWDPNQLVVVPPEGPRPAPGSALTAEL